MHNVTYNDPTEEVRYRAKKYLGQNPGVTLRTAYAAVFKTDPELKAAHDLDMKEIIDAGGRVVKCSNPMMEFSRRMTAHAKEHNVDLKTAYRAVAKEDPVLYQEYNQQQLGRGEQPSQESGGQQAADLCGQVDPAGEEATRRALQYQKEYPGTSLLDAFKTVFRNDVSLWRRYKNRQ